MRRAPVLLLILALAACRTASQPLVSDRLFFGRNIPSGGEVTEAQWEAFLRDVVTPRFPQGLTVYEANGQWRDAEGIIVREPSYVLELFHERKPEVERALAEIAAEYRRRFAQEAVLRATSPATIQLYEGALAAAATSSLCGVTFERPSGSVVEADAQECQAQIAPANAGETDLARARSTVRIRVGRSDYASALRQAGFEQRNGRWVVLGRHGIASDAAEVMTNTARGVRGVAQVGAETSDGTYAGIMETPRAVVRVGEVVVWIESGAKGEEVFEQVLRSIRSSKSRN